MRKIVLSLLLTVSTMALSQQNDSIEECKIDKPADGDLSGANAAVAKMRDVCLPKIRQIAECTSRTRLLSEAVTAFISKFRKPTTNVPLLVVASYDIENF